MRIALVTLIMLVMAVPAMAQDVDLILPPNLQSDGAPFYQEAKVKIGDQVVPVKSGKLPNGTLAKYLPDQKAVIISDAAGVSEEAKGQALLEVVIGLQANTIATAAGQ